MSLKSLIGDLRTLADAVARHLKSHRLDDVGKADAVAPLREKIIAIRDALLNRYRLPTSSSKSVFVSHYTKLCVVQAILKEACNNPNGAALRRYSSSRLNDPTEGILLLGALRDSAPACLDPNDTRPAYIASFVAPQDDRDEDSSEPTFDNLRYWRYYGDDGAGCSLHVSVQRDRLHRVLYGATDLKETVRDLADVCGALSGVLVCLSIFVHSIGSRLATV